MSRMAQSLASASSRALRMVKTASVIIVVRRVILTYFPEEFTQSYGFVKLLYSTSLIKIREEGSYLLVFK